MAFAEYAHYDGLGLAELVAKKQVTPLELVEEAIARIEKHNPTLNAVVRAALRLRPRHRRGARRRARSAACRSCSRTSSATSPACRRSAARASWSICRAPQDDTLVVRFKAAGLVPLGKTNVPEFGLLPTTESACSTAPAHNPWNLAHSTGGSSGGSAAAVAAGIVPMAHANDGGGSIRIPASCCGLVGLKPTRGRNPLGPMLGDIMSGLICEHVVSRTVRDTAAMLDCTAGPEPGDPYWSRRRRGRSSRRRARRPGRLRIAFATSNPPARKRCTPNASPPSRRPRACARSSATSSRRRRRRSIGADHAVVPGRLVRRPGDADRGDGDADRARDPLRADFEGLTWALYEQGKQITGAQYLMALAMLQMTGPRRRPVPRDATTAG